MSKSDGWGSEKDSDLTDGWVDEISSVEYESSLRPSAPACGGVRFEPEGSKGSFDWGLAISASLLIGMISIIGHLINMWRN
jgi:hypothetical protein